MVDIDLAFQLQKLAQARAAAEVAKTELANFDLPVRYHELNAAVNATKDRVKHLDEIVRTLAQAAYLKTQDKNPAPGVKIGTGNKIELTYDPDKALAWAKARDMALMLDKDAFEKIATATKLEFVTSKEVETQRIAIASDLLAFYKLEEEPTHE
jgi:hypothetical protein